MISKTFEWYRIVSATPSSQAVEARTKAATELVSTLSKEDPVCVVALAQGIARDFSGAAAEAKATEWLLRTLKRHDPAVSESLSENQLELRCIAAITFGEILVRSKQKSNKNAPVAAAAFVSAMNIRPLPKQRYLRTMLEELSDLALDVIDGAADARRTRVLTTEDDREVEVTDLPSAASAIANLQTQIANLGRNAIMDREEIALFWFVATAFSRTKRKPFSELPVSIAAVHAALEVSGFVLAPAPLNCFEIVAAIVESKRTPDSLTAVPLSDHLGEWTKQEWDAIAGDGSIEADLASQFPAVFPIIWIANRMREAKSLPKWSEFKKATHLQGDADIRATQFARQLLCEKIAVSMTGAILG